MWADECCRSKLGDTPNRHTAFALLAFGEMQHSAHQLQRSQAYQRFGMQDEHTLERGKSLTGCHATQVTRPLLGSSRPRTGCVDTAEGTNTGDSRAPGVCMCAWHTWE